MKNKEEFRKYLFAENATLVSEQDYVSCFKNEVKHYLVLEHREVYEFEETFLTYYW